MTFINSIGEYIPDIQINGTYKGRAAVSVNVLGKRRDTFGDTTSLYDLGEFLTSGETNFPDPSAGIVMEIISTSANDASAGTGA